MSPVLLDDEVTPTPPCVISSLAVSLACAMCGAGAVKRGEPMPKAAVLPLEFWEDGFSSGDELVLLAYWAGALDTTDFNGLLDVATTRPRPPGALRLAGEQPEARESLTARIDELRRSARRRQGYGELLEAVWQELGPWWRRTNRRVHRAVDQYTAELAAGRSWRSIGPNPRREAFLDGVLGEIGYDIPVVLAPAMMTGSLFVLDADDALVVGLPVPEPDLQDGTEDLAHLLKALSHPTRLAVVRSLARQPSSVGELARQFDVAQPTMTAHVRQLREAGLIRRDEDGHKGLTLDQDATRALSETLGELLVTDPA